MRLSFPLALAALAACASPEDASVPDAESASTVAAALPPAPAPGPAVKHLPSDRIYYDLTRFQWYARGEPLRHEGLAYQPSGMPVAIPLAEMEQIGAYDGVDYYRRAGADALLFVPVFDGYWLAFRPVATAPVTAD